MKDLSGFLITGGSGMVGSQIPFGFKPKRQELDVTDSDSVTRYFEKIRPTGVIHLAALNLAQSETDPEMAHRTNVEGTINIASRCARANIPLVVVSSCAVFDGKKSEPYLESDTPNPLNIYGQTKREAEKQAIKHCPTVLIVRTGWVFGGTRDIKFIRRFIEAMRNHEPVRATKDRFGSPTYVPDLLYEIEALLSSGQEGIVHVVNDGIFSYAEIAALIRDLLGSDAHIEAIPSAQMEAGGPLRGRMEGLASERHSRLRPCKEALAEYIRML